MKQYNPKDIEPKWQQIWEETGLYKAEDFSDKPKQYILAEFPYPSGDGLHVGHVRRYTASDILARWYRMRGYNVMHPIGWDGFGLPAENAAIKNRVAPQKIVKKNIDTFRKQLKTLGLGFDWDREIDTTDPDYYRWTQWIFLQLFKHNLAYQKEMPVNWCPKCKVGLADEEVINGLHERCETPVEKRMLRQWMLKITEYADRLIEDLKLVDYPEQVATQQINWIGRSVGARIEFSVVDSQQSIQVFTTRPDTLFGATYMILAPEHSLVPEIVTESQKNEVERYVEQTEHKSDLERQEEAKSKTGVFTGAYAVNPCTKEKIPIWIADYVLMEYGTGAIMAVPAHDERDYEFAQKFDLPITQVIDADKLPYPGEGVLINSGQYTGIDSEKARERIVADLTKEDAAKEEVNYKLRDWIFSRQHYWGEPIPIVHCDECGAVPVPENELPITLPEVEQYEPTDTGESPLAKIKEWVNVACPKCGEQAQRETDTMPNWAGSSWYYLRYADPNNDEKFADFNKLKYWLIVDTYIGGMEHTTLHLLYSRFWHKFLYDQELVPTLEPYNKRRPQGMVLAPDGKKMSKSLGNVINPDEIISSGYGADSLRLLEMFLGPMDHDVAWTENGVAGTYRFLNRVWTVVQEYQSGETKDDIDNRSEFEVEADKYMHHTIKKVTQDLENMQFNTAIAALMEYVNHLYKLKTELPPGNSPQVWGQYIGALLRLLAPFSPHITEELWQEIGQEESIHIEPWPGYDESEITDTMVTIAVQINGKTRDRITLPAGSNEEEISTQARKAERIAEELANKEINKAIVVPDKLVNFVVS